ncbi:VOC family protein [Marinilactibacillus sp. GCM10026970]|uniref:VOC family protein n=1 Tax=Marinilactibacillus sp. GCM10026970 TaxID=3252642 RepID=UPI003605B3A2
MKTIAYLQFDGNAAAALSFYEKALQATDVTEVRFGAFGQDPNYPLSEAEQEMIMEARIEFSGSTLMLSDVLPSMQAITGAVRQGNHILISVIDGEPTVNEQLFANLSEGGTVIMPLATMPWSSSFGMLIDPFGVTWKFNGDASKFLNSFDA